jgi:hypothetical protein
MPSTPFALIHAYTRREAIADGVLVAVPPEVARSAGIVHPVAITAALHATAVAVPPGCEGLQEASARLWDLLWMLRCAVKGTLPGTSVAPGPGGIGEELAYQLHVVTDVDHLEAPALVTVRALCGPGDDLEPVMTLMLPDED